MLYTLTTPLPPCIITRHVSFSNQDWDMSTPHNNNNNYCFLSCFYSLALFHSFLHFFLFYLFYLFFFIFNPISNKRDPWAWFYLFSTIIYFILLDVFIQILLPVLRWFVGSSVEWVEVVGLIVFVWVKRWCSCLRNSSCSCGMLKMLRVFVSLFM